VATTSPDLKAEGIASSVQTRPDMTLIENRVIAIGEVDTVLDSVPIADRCALVLIGPAAQTNDVAQRWLVRRDDLVVMLIEIVGDIVRIGLRDPRLESLVTALKELVERVGTQRRERVVSIQLRSGKPTAPGAQQDTQHPLLTASINWVHELLRDAVEGVSDENGDVPGLSVSAATLLQSLDAPAPRDRDDREREVQNAGEALDNALAAARESSEPLAVANRIFALTPLEFRMLILALAPELDLRFQRCIGFLLDEMSRRVGTMGLYGSLLGITPAERGELINGGALSTWLVFEGYSGRPAAADEPLRVDQFLVQWLLGETTSLINDPRVRRTLRLTPWPGASLLQRHEEKIKAAGLIEKLQTAGDPQWLLLDGDDLAAWRALLELGGAHSEANPIRVEANRLTGADAIDVEDCARRIGRLGRLTADPVVIDTSKTEGTPAEDDWLRVFLAGINDTGCKAAVICNEEARIVRLLGSAPYDLIDEAPLALDARVEAVRTAAKGAGAYLTEEAAETITTRYPMHIDALEHSMHLARTRAKNFNADDPDLDRFTAACKELASEGISRLVDRLEPIFTLDDVVLPADRKQQLTEVVDHVRLASRVLDGWKFRDQLPYGRGVAALFSGSSGTGKTMAAMGIARALGIQVLRLDLSRVVSKYIGETEKHLDVVFTDAQRSGAAILIDEADALFGKRSEVKDAHDRYANIEVAYLLQRMESYEGLAILTTNMRKNLDPAFTRRLRFIVDFPKPDAPAREKIWRQCLPAGSHELADVDFRQLARRLELTGGQIRQITLRAAFIAAGANEQIQMKHVANAVRAEFTKLGLPPVEIEVNTARRAA
jgi:AAA+ superfamily predicted ATPase